MSRSDPSGGPSNPCERWLEWQGSRGVIQYYDRATKQKVDLGDDLLLCVLDMESSTIKGWHELSESAIFANSVRDTRTQEIVVKSFKGGEIARGLYRDIRETAKAAGGYFVTNVYAATEVDDGRAALVCLQLSGAALKAWSDFCRGKRSQVEQRAVHIAGANDNQNGSVKYRTPRFRLVDAPDDLGVEALRLDRDVLQPYLRAYFALGAAPPKEDEPSNDQVEESREDDDEIPF